MLDRRTGEPITEVQQLPLPQNDVTPGDWAVPTQPFSTGMPQIGTETLSEASMWG